MKTFFGIAAVCMAFAFFATPVRVSAQQAEKEIFIDPTTMGSVARITHRVDLLNYKVEWEVRSNDGTGIVPRVPFAGMPTVDERFIATGDQFNKALSLSQGNENEREIAIEWNGLPADNRTHIIKEGTYLLIIHTVPRKGRGETETRIIPVTIIPPLKEFDIVLPEKVNRRVNEPLSVKVSERQKAYSWRVRIRDSRGASIVNQPLMGEDSEFPGFLWNEYPDLKPGVPVQCGVTVEATDRTGKTIRATGSFWIVDEEPAHESELAEIRARLARSNNTIAKLNDEIAGLNNTIAKLNDEIADLRNTSDAERDLIAHDLTGIPDSEFVPHIVKRNETLRSISNADYGTPYLWGVIYALNRAAFPGAASPHVLRIGMKLRVPKPEALERLGLIQAK